MKKYVNIFLIIFFTIYFIQCGKDPNDISNLNEQELQQKAEEFYKKHDFQKSIECFQTFLTKFPQSPDASKVLNNLASIFSNDLKDLNSAIIQYKRIINEYPNSKECPNSLFTLGFIYNNELKDYNQARIYYEQFLQKFPNHEAATSARFELENLGKSIEDIIKNLPDTKTANKGK
jgi:TolA-binding protein